MSATIVLNQENIVNTDNNILEYAFPSSVNFNNHEICVDSIAMYYAWENINSIPLNNNQFSYTRYVGGNATVYTITLPDGLYSLKSINALLQYNFVKNGHFLISSTGQYVYFAEFIINSSTYSYQLNTFPVPIASQFHTSSSNPTVGDVAPYIGWTTPVANSKSGTLIYGGWNNQNFNPVISMIAGNNLYKLLGFASDFVSTVNLGVNTNLTFQSTSSPKITPNFNLFLGITNIDNEYSNPSSIIHSISPTVGFGEQIIDRPNEHSWNKLIQGSYNRLRLQILGSDKQPVKILDPEICIVLKIRNKSS